MLTGLDSYDLSGKGLVQEMDLVRRKFFVWLMYPCCGFSEGRGLTVNLT